MNKDMKYLIIGHARHGKDTVAEILHANFGFSYKDSSRAASEHVVFPVLRKKYGYQTVEECYEDRVNHRAEWFDLISDYNNPDYTKLARDILKDSDIYVGMRRYREFIQADHEGLFDLVIAVDACDRLPKEPKESFDIPLDAADVILTNNGSIEEFTLKVNKLGRCLKKARWQ